jgi:hypothetical protein
VHAFLDESTRDDGYMLCVAAGDGGILRTWVDALRPQGNSRIHTKFVSKKDASKLVTEVPRWMQPASLPRQIGKEDRAASPRPAPRRSRALCRRV